MSLDSKDKASRFNRRNVVQVLMLLIGAALAGFGLRIAQDQLMASARAAPVLSVDDAFLDFGETWIQKDFIWNLPIRNESSRRVTISGVRFSCNCSEVSPELRTIPPGALVELPVKIDLTGQRDGRFRVQMAPQVNGHTPNPPIVWELTGSLKRQFTASQENLVFTEDVIRGLPPPRRTVLMKCHPDVRDVKVEADPSVVRTTIEELDDGEFFLSVIPSNGLLPGRFQTLILFHGTDAYGRSVSPFPFRVAGRSVEPVGITPATLALGLVGVGDSVRVNVLLWSRTGSSFEIVDVRSDNKGLSVKPLATSTEGERNYLVTLVVARGGMQHAALRFATMQDGKLCELPFSVSFFGTDRRLEQGAAS